MPQETIPTKPASNGAPKPVSSLPTHSRNIVPRPDPVTIPTEIAGRTFNIEQLPPLDDPDSRQAPSPVTKEESPKKEEVTKKEPDATKTEPTKKEETTKEVVQKEEKEEVSPISKFLKPPKGSEEKKEETKKEEDKKEEPKGLKAPDKDQFDYNGFSESEVVTLKNMSRQSREVVSKLIKENKEFKQAKEQSYLQHPQAYTLLPEYQQAQVDVQFAFKEAQIYQKQLEDAKLGKPITPLTGFDNKTGEPIYGKEIESNDAIEETLRMNMNNCIQTANRIQGQLQQVPRQYEQMIQRDHQAIEQEMSSRFAWVADPKLLDYSIEVNGKGDVPIKNVIQDFTNLFPSYLRNNQGVRVAANLFVSLILAQNEVKESQQGKQIAEIKKEEAQRGEPSSEIKPSKEEDSKFGVREFSLSGMPT